jgi:hypothetical protein
VSTSSPIELSSGLVTKADRLIITLVQPPDTPEAILIIWPLKPTVVEPAKLQATVAAIVKVLSTPRSSTPRDASAVYAARDSGPRSSPNDDLGLPSDFLGTKSATRGLHTRPDRAEPTVARCGSTRHGQGNKVARSARSPAGSACSDLSGIGVPPGDEAFWILTWG